MESIGSPLLWGGFFAFVLVMLALDLGLFHRKTHVVSLREAAGWSAAWVALAGLFGVGVYAFYGKERALEFTTGYVIEKALAVDNIFVFVMVFAAFAIPPLYQHRVLFWGVLGALVMRAIFVFAGSALISRFHAILYLFGGVLVLTGIKMLVKKDSPPDLQNNPVVKIFARLFPIKRELHGERFTVVEKGKRYATPLLAALVVIEVFDLVFAVDSIPAIFAVTTDPFIVLSSNVFAIFGLRSMYFLLAAVIERFAYLKIGLSFVLMFVGAKMLLMDIYKVPIWASLTIIASVLAASVIVSLIKTRQETPASEPA